MTLDQVCVGQTVEIIGMTQINAQSLRLMEMGFVEHTPLQMIQKGFHDQIIEIYIRHYFLSIRKKEAAYILVKEISHE